MNINEEQLIALSKFVLQNETKKDNVCASINFISSQEIQQFNKKYRKIDAPTDVLSFEAEDIDGDLGDIFICPEIAQSNAKKFNTSLDSELKLLVVHGMLHLCGYDHIDNEEAEIMEAREEEYLDAWERQQL